MTALSNRKIMSLSFKDDVYICDIAIKKSYLVECSNYFFVLQHRNAEEEAKLPFFIRTETTDFYIIHIEISLIKFKDFLTGSDITDFSIVRVIDNEEKRSRVRSNYDYIEFLKIPLTGTHVLYPATTRKGNLSFYFREAFLYSKFEEVEITNDGILNVFGVFQNIGLMVGKNAKYMLLITSNINNDEIYVPIKLTTLAEDKYGNYVWYSSLKQNGYYAQVNLKQYFSLGKMQYLKFHLLMEHEVNEEIMAVQSNRIKINHLNKVYPLKRKFKCGRSVVQVICKPTKKSKYFSLSMGEYRFFISFLKRVKQKWINIRRSGKLLQIYKSAFYVCGKVLPVDKNLVIFESFHGKQFSDNPRAIYEYMRKHNRNLDLVWSADRRHINNFENKDIKYVRRFSVKWLLQMARANYWITNARLPLWIPKPKHTIYLQTWHGTPLKRLAADMEEVHMPGTNTSKYKENFAREAGKWDYLISPNAYSTEIFKRAFCYNKEIIESGYPRNDYLYNNNDLSEAARLKKGLEIDENKKVILYAPTWRDNQFYRKGKYRFDLEFDLKKLKEAFGHTHVIVLRLHYLVSEQIDINDYKGFVYDLSKHEDIRELYLISDLLITDYSSVFFDYANLKRPMLFFVYDIEEYRDTLRGFYFNFEEKAPGPLVKTTDEIIYEIQKLEQNGFNRNENYQEFLERFCYLEDGNATKRVVQKLFE
ncbi:CDP-glycerol glycerophosphotransferase family protein [Virgibacillus dokdonensis]|uniref:CDP-glycerol:poly(Glycerophosphate) glycerophosphotransferase n=1 Tax=Virgibacillus dokdonensis TaxID=302167 RepID=A0A2K9IYT4_9BACI|nr:CDP-glycerol glycerophosphotransferase family protein [Virgibacillus dokdonensis]AUJ23973.1 CDP-glycerol:poly(glycerophosphate) glycerophosphotransferase [Virgibacillus dokdonensis]